MFKRLVAIGDMHCGAVTGLTPPPFQYRLGLGPDYIQARAQLQRECWSWYVATLEKLQPIDILVVNGDMIDGKGCRSGATELVTSDMQQQSDIAATCILEAKASRIFCIYGTPYHVSADGEDMESLVASKVGASISGHEWIDVNGCVFDVKHKVGSSQIPHGRHTAIARERLWNQLWSERAGAPKASIILRSHVHYYDFCGSDDFLAMTLPALQAPGSKYGVRQCSGVVHYGMVSFDIDDNGGYLWQPHLLNMRSGRPVAVKV